MLISFPKFPLLVLGSCLLILASCDDFKKGDQMQKDTVPVQATPADATASPAEEGKGAESSATPDAVEKTPDAAAETPAPLAKNPETPVAAEVAPTQEPEKAPRPPRGEFDSVYESLPPDPSAIVLGSEKFPVAGDGVTDDTAAIQAGLAAGGSRLVFLPSGRYLISGTLEIKKGTRLIGYGAERPELIVAPNTEAFRDAESKAYVVKFLYQEGKKGNDTFYSAFDNINIRIADGNPGAVGVFFDVAQGTVLKNVDMHLGAGNTGVHRIGNEISNVRIYGGDYGITGGTVAWQVLVMDCVLEGQAKAAFGTSGTAPTLIRTTIRNTPIGFEVPTGNTKVVRAYAKDCRFEEISDTLMLRDDSQHAAMQLSLEDSVFINCPNLVRMREGDTVSISEDPVYVADLFCYGLNLQAQSAGRISKDYGVLSKGVRAVAEAPAGVPTDILRLPEVAEWKSVRDFGVTGDGVTDVTEAIQKAIDTEECLFFPRGRYLVTKPLQMREGSKLIGLHPYYTLIQLKSGSEGFGKESHPEAIVKSSVGGENIFRGIGIEAGHNPGSVAMLWQAGERSLIDDFWISWAGDGTTGKSQYLGLWVKGGGGVVRNMWAANRLSRFSVFISDTKLPGKFYLASLEHHLEGELILQNVSNWTFNALQTETHVRDVPEKDQTLPIRMVNCTNTKFTNLYIFQTTGSKETLPRGLLGSKIKGLTILGSNAWSYNKAQPELFLEIPEARIKLDQLKFTSFQTQP